jgi:asparagine synthase (glutamine-hydrolysing)
MCGIAGILHFGSLGDAEARVGRMADSIAHRGPDDDGFWSDGDIALGFRRLAIVDLETGQQPMSNEDGTVRVVFNGEIYNHAELRRELEEFGHRFRTDHSDTETIVHGYEQWGDALACHLEGMFAIAIWDSGRRHLRLIRDRFGIKPLYIAAIGDGRWAFASEVRALHASGLIAARANNQSVFAYFLQQNVFGERSMFAGVEQLPPGHFRVVAPGCDRTTKYWDFTFRREKRTAGEAAEMVRIGVEQAIRRQVAADVPVMAYLSGGVDSSSLVAGAFRLDPGVRAYSCLFDLEGVGDDMAVDERQFSRAVARKLGIEHIELELPQVALIGALQQTIDALEEPRMGMAYVNYLIAQRVARDSKVVLSGCGGDEIFGGYVGRYAQVRAPYNAIPARIQRLFGLGAIGTRDPRRRMLEMVSYPIGLRQIAAAFEPKFLKDLEPYSVADAVDRILAECPSDDDWDMLMYLDAKTYLAGLLMVEDKLSMSHGLETRVPLLDEKLAEIACTLAWENLSDGTTGKQAFRDAIRDWVPVEIADKPKMGFGPPDASWYRGALQPFVREVLSPHRIAARGVLRPEYVQRIVDSHMSGRANQVATIWTLLSFDAWCERFDLFGGKFDNLGEKWGTLGVSN